MVAATAEAGTGQRSSVPGRRDVLPPPTPGSWPLQVPLVLKTILVSPWGGRLRPRPRTCCCCGRRGDLRAVPAPPGRRSLPRAPGTAEGRRGSAGPAAGPPGTRGRAASGATPSAPSGLGEAAPAPRASSGAHPPPWQHFGSRISPNMSKSPLPGSVAGRDKGPEATAGPRAGAQDAQPRSALRRPPAAPRPRPRPSARGGSSPGHRARPLRRGCCHTKSRKWLWRGAPSAPLTCNLLLPKGRDGLIPSGFRALSFPTLEVEKEGRLLCCCLHHQRHLPPQKERSFGFVRISPVSNYFQVVISPSHLYRLPVLFQASCPEP